MRKPLFCLFCTLCIVFCGMGTMDVSAQKRTPNELHKLTKKRKRVKMPDGGSVKVLDLALLDTTKYKLNDIERSLCARFDHVKIIGCPFYYVIKDDSIQGVYGLDGEELLTPSYFDAPLSFSGRFCKQKGRITGFGGWEGCTSSLYYCYERSDKKQSFTFNIIPDINSKLYTVIGYNDSVCMRFFKVKNCDVSTKIILPPGKYDEMYAMNGGSDIRVVRIDSLGERLYGAVDMYGEEVIPCKYKGVGYSKYGGTLISSMTQTSEELDQIRNTYLAEQYQQYQQFQQQIQQQIQQSQQVCQQITDQYLYPSASSSAPSKSSSKSTSVNSSNGNSVSESQSKNTDQRTYSGYEAQLIRMNTYWEREYNDSNRRYIQQQMRAIRTKWENRGYSMYHSPWEDWDGSKK